jgi:hypothetical protein
VRLQRGDPAAQVPRQHLLDLGQGAQRRLLAVADAVHRGGAQPHGDGHGLVVVEQQRRDAGAAGELVPARRAGAGRDLVAELAQPVDVPAQRPLGDRQPLGELGPGPVAVGLQQGQQPEHPRRRIGHDPQSTPPCGQLVA